MSRRGRWAYHDAHTQKQSLERMVVIAARSSIHERVFMAAREIEGICEGKDDDCALAVIFDAVKHGHPAIRGLERGVRYVRDPLLMEVVISPRLLLENCENGGPCAEDCDSHAMLVAALGAAVGFRAGLRIFQPDGEDSFTHIYAVSAKSRDYSDSLEQLNEDAVGLDTTVASSSVGWEPSPGRIKTIFLEQVPEDLLLEK